MFLIPALLHHSPWILKLIDTRDLDFIIGSDEQFKNENITKIFKQ